jgi:hypothetical protein
LGHTVDFLAQLFIVEEPMTEERDDGKSIKERLEDFVKEMFDALESLVTPAPALVPVPIRAPRRPYRR